jgi:uncharacterized membrane protein YgaE (UPF0421/DUF939 family)
MTSTSSPGRRPFPLALPPWTQLRRAIADGVVVGLSCLLTYWLATTILAHVYSPSAADDELGGLWAVIATVFVLRETYDKSVAAAVSRTGATLVSFALCLLYLAFLPFHLWGLAVLTGLSGLVASLIGRPEDSITAAITTAVVLIVAEVSPRDAWQQPILRLADTVIGVAVGRAAAWLVRRAGRSKPTAGASANGTSGPAQGATGG